MNDLLGRLLLALAAVTFPATALAAAEGPKPLFAGEGKIHIVIKGPVAAVARTGERTSEPRPATLAVAGQPGTLPIVLAPRGISRRTSEICQFSPLRVEFSQPPPAASLFKGQKKLKLVTHCRRSEDYQHHLLLEYAAYKMYNLLTPTSLRVRLATVDYVEEDGKPLTSRLAFFIEDTDDAAKRLGMREAKVGARISRTQLSPRDAAREAVFQYFIANLDWAMTAGPEGESCCHNTKLVGAASGKPVQLVPIPYDFDMSGFVSAPYAFPPEQLKVSSVRERLYRGYCIHNAEARAAAADLYAKRAQLKAVLDGIPELAEAPRTKAWRFLDGFLGQLGAGDATPKFLTGCIG